MKPRLMQASAAQETLNAEKTEKTKNHFQKEHHKTTRRFWFSPLFPSFRSVTMNRNAARYAVPTENGAAALGFEGATHFMTGSGTRGGALAAMSQHLVGSRGADAVRHAKAVSGLTAPAAATATALVSKRPDCRRGAVIARLKAHKAQKLQQKRHGAKAGSGGGGARTGLGQTQLESFIAEVFAESETLDDAAAATDNAVDLFCMVVRTRMRGFYYLCECA